MNRVVIAPHPDDESIGPGGSIRLLTAAGNRMVVVFLTSGERGIKNEPVAAARRIREREAEKALEILGVQQADFLRQADWYMNMRLTEAVDALTPILERERPGEIYLPNPDETHPDHAAAREIVVQAWARAGSLPMRLLLYEVWTPLRAFQHVEDITLVMNDKLKAIAVHRSQLKQLRYDRAVRGLNGYRGALAANSRFAEVFAVEDIGASDGK